ncbi:MAG: hypothetical protein ACYDCO_04615 [Armatimonadota bacterium]
MREGIRGMEERLPPMVRKEMRSLMRGRRAPVILFSSAAVAAGVGCGTYFLGFQSVSGAGAYAEVGRQLFGVLILLEAVLVLVLMPALCAGSMLREYRQGTLESLLLTRLTPRNVIAGKLYAALGFVLVVLLAVLPVMAVAFLLGGVSPWEVLAMHLLLLVFAWCAGATSLYMAARFPRGEGAFAPAYLLAFAWILFPLPVLCVGLPVSSLTGLLSRLHRQGSRSDEIIPVIFLLLMVISIITILLATGFWSMVVLLFGNPATLLVVQLFADDFFPRVWSVAGLVFFALVLSFGARLMYDRAVALVKRRLQETDEPFQMQHRAADQSEGYAFSLLERRQILHEKPADKPN